MKKKQYVRNTKNVEKFERLKQFSRELWKELTVEEQELFFYSTGTIGFIEDCARTLHINLDEDFDDFTDEDSMNDVSWFDELLDNLPDFKQTNNLDKLVNYIVEDIEALQASPDKYNTLLECQDVLQRIKVSLWFTDLSHYETEEKEGE
jgi:hypothetical protein